MPRAFDLFAYQLTLTERTAIVRADIIDRKNVAGIITKSNLTPFSRDHFDLAFWDVVHTRDLHDLRRHDQPPMRAKCGATSSRIMPLTLGSPSFSNTSLKNPSTIRREPASRESPLLIV